MKISVEELSDITIPRLSLRSVSMSLCTVEVHLDEGMHVLCDRNGKVARFNGVEHARNSLSHLQVQQAELVHDSPYDEMVGLPEGGSEPIRVPLQW
jgi:hypothetical protein